MIKPRNDAVELIEPAAAHQKTPQDQLAKKKKSEEQRRKLRNQINNKTDIMEKSNSQYDSFLFWRQPIPALDLSELEDLGLTGNQPVSSRKTKDKTFQRWNQDDEGELSEFSSFNYWRAPIADVDALLADLNLLL